MKKTIVFIMFCAILLSMSACNATSKPVSDMSKMLNIEIVDEDINMLQSSDSHGGWLGDGVTFYSIEIINSSIIEEIKSEWKAFPLTDNITALVYGLDEKNPQTGPYITENGEALFPPIENGYYYFYDRHRESKDPYDDTNVLARFSFNFIVSIFDLESNRLYFCKFDT